MVRWDEKPYVRQVTDYIENMQYFMLFPRISQREREEVRSILIADSPMVLQTPHSMTMFCSGV